MQNPRPKVLVQSAPGRSAEREATLSGREVARPWAPSSSEIRTNRLLLVITVLTGLAFAIVAVIGFQLILYLARGPAIANAPECVENDPDHPCPAGQFCQGGRCRVEPTDDICDAGDPCGARGSCTCEAPMRCEADRCVEPAESLPPPDVCDRPEVQKHLAALHRECQGNLGRCPPGSLKKFAIKYDGFDELMAAFPGTMTIHFPDGRPFIGAADQSSWPNTKTRDTYLERIRRSGDALRDAKFIFIIARSSPHGDSRRNGLYAQQRSIYVKDWLYAALEIPTNERDAFNLKLREFILGHKRRLGRDFFAERYGNRFVTWDKPSRSSLVKLLKAPNLSDEDAEWLDRTINQVVLVVPVPCDFTGNTNPAAGAAAGV
jgi:hypothetical protein